MGVACSTHGEVSSSYRIFVGKLGRERPLGMWGVILWSGLIWLSVGTIGGHTVVNFQVP